MFVKQGMMRGKYDKVVGWIALKWEKKEGRRKMYVFVPLRAFVGVALYMFLDLHTYNSHMARDIEAYTDIINSGWKKERMNE